MTAMVGLVGTKHTFNVLGSILFELLNKINISIIGAHDFYDIKNITFCNTPVAGLAGVDYAFR